MNKRQEAGSSLAFALFVVLVVGAAVSTLTSSGRVLSMDAQLDRAGAVALAAAEGGVEWCRATIAQGKSLAVEPTTLRIGTAEVSVAIEPTSEATWRVRSIARVPGPRLPVQRMYESRLLKHEDGRLVVQSVSIR